MLFCVWEDARVWAHWNHSFHLSPQLSGARVLFHPWVPQSSPWWVAAVWWRIEGRYSFLPEFPQGSPAHHPWWLQSLILWHPLFTDMAGNIPFLIKLRAERIASPCSPGRIFLGEETIYAVAPEDEQAGFMWGPWRPLMDGEEGRSRWDQSRKRSWIMQFLGDGVRAWVFSSILSSEVAFIKEIHRKKSYWMLLAAAWRAKELTAC